MERTEHNGSELHRLKPMQENYDQEMFNRLYKICKPVIRNLTRQIDYKRLDVTPDIISSYFWDKLLFVFNKYYGTMEEEHLKANILRSLSTFKNKLLRKAYGEEAEINKGKASFEELYDNDKEYIDDTEEETAKSEMLKKVYDYMYSHLSSDAQLVFEVLMTPPPYIKERTKEGSRITNILLTEFFDLPRNRESIKFFSGIRQDIQYWEDRAKKELKF